MPHRLLVWRLKFGYKKSVETLFIFFEVSANTLALTNNLTTLPACPSRSDKSAVVRIVPVHFVNFADFRKRETNAYVC